MQAWTGFYSVIGGASAALRMAVGGQDERDWFAAAAIALLFAAITVSWKFLIGLARAEVGHKE